MFELLLIAVVAGCLSTFALARDTEEPTTPEASRETTSGRCDSLATMSVELDLGMEGQDPPDDE